MLHHLINKRDEKCRCLPGAGRGETDDILAEERVRNSLVLNRRWKFVFFRNDVLLQMLIDVKVGELVLGNEYRLFGRNDRLVHKF